MIDAARDGLSSTNLLSRIAVDSLSPAYLTGDVIYRKALPHDDESMRKILGNNYMDSWVQMSFEREPSFFDGENLMGESDVVIAHENNPSHTAVGMYSCAFVPALVNGKPERVGYLGGLRVNRSYRHKVRILKNGFASIRTLLTDQRTVPIWFTSVASENALARRILEAGLNGMPIYRLVGEMETLAFATKQGKLKGLLQRATLRDVPALVDFFNRRAEQYQFSPVLTEVWLHSLSGKKGLSLRDFWLVKDNNDLRGCLAIWDQRAFKQTIVRGYRFPLSTLRGPYNLFAGVTKRLKFPAMGEKLEQAFMSFAAFDSSANDLAVEAVSEGLARARQKGAEAGILGVSVANPIAGILKKSLQASVYRTCIETVSWPESPGPILDGRPPQPEVAIL